LNESASSRLWPFTGGPPRLDAPIAPVDCSITILGDIRIEARSELTHLTFPDITHDALAFSSARLTISGTAVNMAKQAVAAFGETAIIAKIGEDEFSIAIRDHIDALGIKSHLIIDPSIGNGAIIIVRDDNRANPGGSRLLISSEPAPSHRLSIDDIDSFESQLTATSLLFVDGYSLLRQASGLAVRRAVSIAQTAGARICVDLVPHDLERYISSTQLRPYLNSADYIIAEARTVAAIFGLPNTYPFTTDDVQAVLPAIDEYVPGNPYWLLRYGIGDMEDVLMYRRHEIKLDYHTGYAAAPRADQAGYGDRIAVRELVALLSRPS
jgi:sugar/nucleoside kinase (ribokinase family)